MNLYQRIKNAGAAFFGAEIPRYGAGGGYSAYDLGSIISQGGSVIDWAREAKPYYNNPIVAICYSKIASMIGEAKIALQQKNAKTGEWEPSTHPASIKLERLLARPNDFETWAQIERAMTLSYSVFGEAYLYVRRNQFNEPIGFTFLSPGEVKPMADKYNPDGTLTITYFEHTAKNGGTQRELPLDNVLFFRKGINPEDPKRGFSEVLQTIREIVLYNDSATRHGAMVKNPASGKLIYPDISKDGVQPTFDQVSSGTNLINGLVADRAGKAAMVPFKVGVQDLGMKPNDMDLSKIRQSAIEIICPAFGGDPMAFGLTSTSKKYDNLDAALDDLGKQTVLPMLSDWGEALSKFFVKEFGLDQNQYRVAYLTNGVSWLLDETSAEHERARENFKAGGLSLASFKLKIGETPIKGDEQRTYFSIQTENAPAPTQTNSVSDWAKAIVTKDAQSRRTTGRIQVNAIQAKTENGKQGAHDKRIAKAKKTLIALTEQNQAGTLDSDAYQIAFSDELRDLHADMYKIGRELAGNAATAEEAERIALQVTDSEQAFLAGLVADLADGRYDGITPALDQRLGMYASKSSSTASLGFVDGSGDDEEFYWDMNGAVEDHCQDCPYLEANSPYLKDTLYTAPRRGDTPCKMRCGCELVRASDGQRGFKAFAGAFL